MGDIWPYGPPVYTSWDAVYNWYINNGFSTNQSAIFAAIAEAEAGFDLSVINDTPDTGDYSVGTLQINYYGQLYAERVGLFGTPQQLIAGGLNAQAKAAQYLWSGAGGWSPWSTYNSGAYQQYLHGNPPGSGTAGEVPGGNALNVINAPTEDYSATILGAAQSLHGAAAVWYYGGISFGAIKDTNPNG